MLHVLDPQLPRHEINEGCNQGAIALQYSHFIVLSEAPRS